MHDFQDYRAMHDFQDFRAMNDFQDFRAMDDFQDFRAMDDLIYGSGPETVCDGGLGPMTMCIIE